MKKTWIGFAIACIIAIMCACGGNNNSNNHSEGTKFNPVSTSDSEDADREAKLAAKRTAYQSKSSEYAEMLEFEGKIKLTALVPEEDGLSTSEMKLIESKLIQMSTANGVGGLGGSPRFVLAPEVTVLSKDVTSTAPPKHLLNYDITFYVADIVSGTVFATENIQIKGVGESDARAFIAAFKNLNVKDARFQKFIKTAQEKILAYYKAHGGDFLKEADMLAAKGDYAQALAVLASIPTEAEPYYAEAVKKAEKYFQKYLDDECGVALAMMKSSLGGSFSGEFNETAMNYYAMIPAKGSCKAEADAVYKQYMDGLDAEKRHNWEREEKEWQSQMKQQDADNAFRAQKEELKARVEISANECLLDKYKKDANYNKLPWIRKVTHLGDRDPFDGYKPKKGC